MLWQLVDRSTFMVKITHNFWPGIYVLYSPLLHLPPLRFQIRRMMLGLNPGLLRLWHWRSDALTTRLDLIELSIKFWVQRKSMHKAQYQGPIESKIDFMNRLYQQKTWIRCKNHENGHLWRAVLAHRKFGPKERKRTHVDWFLSLETLH
jgi:hypothetical protein